MREPFDEAEIARYSESERWQYFESQKEYWDNYSIMTTALNKGYPLEDIAEVTGLSPEEVERL